MCVCDLNNGKKVGFITIDLCKAFDLLNISILLSKFSIYGCSIISLKWFRSYLTDRRQKVSFKNV